MPSKKPGMCPICHRPGLINLSQHLSGVHRIGGQERKQLIQRGMVGSESNGNGASISYRKAHQLP